MPYGIECTALLTSSTILSSNSAIDSFAKRLSHATAVIRFVNGFLDSQQTAQFAMPLTALAIKIGMPTSFVELRHACTHEALPGLQELSRAVEEALEWVRVRYWIPELRRLEEVESSSSTKICEWLLKYAEMCKLDENDEEDVDVEFEMSKSSFGMPHYRANNTSTKATAYWQAINTLIRLELLDPQLFAKEFTDFAFSYVKSSVGDRTPSSLDSINHFSPLLQRLSRKVVTAFTFHCLETLVSSYKALDQPDKVFYPTLVSTSGGQEDSSIILLQETTFAHTPTTTPLITHAKNWLRHILSAYNHKSTSSPRFDLVFKDLTNRCAELSSPTPVLLDVLMLACANLRLTSEDVKFLTVYREQVGMLYGEIKDDPKIIETRVEEITQSEVTEVEQQVEEVGVSEPWSLYRGAWKPKPLGVL